MTDIEKRKAALKEFDTLTYEADGIDERVINLFSCDAVITIRELLAPSPQAPDSEVTNAIDILEGMGKEVLPASWQNTFFASFDVLKKAAQQPRQEWLDISTAPRDGTYFYAWFPAGNSFVHAHAEKCWYNNGDLLIIASRVSNHAAPTHWRPDFEQPLPEPPKEK